MKLVFHIFAIAALGKGLSGSDRIFIEFAKRLITKNKVTLYLWEEGYEMVKREGLSNVKYRIINVDPWCKFGFIICYFARIIVSIWTSFFIKIDNRETTIIYSASEFWMDSLPALILKIRYQKVKWVAAWFQTAPNPFVGFAQGNRKNAYKLSAFYYWLMQIPIKPLIEKFADFVLINNELERKQFPNLNKRNKTIVIIGAVNVKEIDEWISQHKNTGKIYEAVFQGRFHPQKGVEELIDIWKQVTQKLPKAKLAMIGDGPLMSNVKNKVKEFNLDKNVHLFGYLFDGDKKFEIFSRSKIVVHPAYYDSGGMASAEAMAFGIPGVGFNLDSYKSYYPAGMVKVPVGDIKEFADTVHKLSTNEKERNRVGHQAREMISRNWNWDQRVKQLLRVIS